MEKIFFEKIVTWIWLVLFLFIKVCIILFLILVLYIVYSIVMMNPNLKKTEQIWSWIVNKIELYKEKKWEYPLKLEDLIPGYYDKIPKSKSGLGRFHYWLEKDKKTYRLFSTFGLTWTYSYYSDLKLWSKRYKNDLIKEKEKVIQKVPINPWYIKLITVPESEIVHIVYDNNYRLILKEFMVKKSLESSINISNIKDIWDYWILKYYIETDDWLLLFNKKNYKSIDRPFWYYKSSGDDKYIISLSNSWMYLEFVDSVFKWKIISKEIDYSLDEYGIKFNWNILEYTTNDRVKHSLDLSNY